MNQHYALFIFTPVHVSGPSVARHQEVEFINVATGTCFTSKWSVGGPGRNFPSRPAERQSVWAPWSVGMGAEILASTGIRSPDFRARIESLYRLCYPGPCRQLTPKFNSNPSSF
jgi:hypothetical protein